MALSSLLSPSKLRYTIQLSLALILAACSLSLRAGEANSPARQKMSGVQGIAGGVFAYAVSPDGSRVVYGADPEIRSIDGLFSVPTAGGAVTPLIEDVDITAREFLAISSDGGRVVYVRRGTNGAEELFSIPVLGGAEVKLNPPFSSDRSVRAFVLAGSRVIYWADQDTNDEELYSVPITGGTAVKLNGALASDEVQDDFQVSPDGSRVVYRAAHDSVGVEELYSAPTDGSVAAVKLNGALASSEVDDPFIISPDGTRVVYVAAQETAGVFELYSAPIDGSAAATKISDTLVEDGDVSSHFSIAPDSSRVVYQADQDIDGVQDLYSVPLLGGTVTKLTDEYVAGGGLSSGDWTVSAQHVAFVADRDTDEILELFTVPIGGGAVTKVSGSMVADGDVSTSDALIFTGDGGRILYAADQVEDEKDELFSSLVGGGGNVKLNGTLARAPGLGSYGTFDTSSVWYEAAQDSLDRDLYRIPADASSPAEKVNGPLVEGAIFINEPTLTATQILYIAEQDTLGVRELYASSLAGGVPIKLNGPITALGGRIDNVLPTPDGQRVVYRGSVENILQKELFVAELATGQITKLASTIANSDVDDEHLSADGTRVVYRAPQDQRDISELYSVPVTGGASTRLNPDLVAGGLVVSLSTKPSTDRVVYAADQETENEVELYSAPIAGGPVVKLNDPLPQGGDVSSSRYTISPSGAVTVYLADQIVNDLQELFAVPTTGGPVVPLSSAMSQTSGGLIAPDESRVVYVADEDTASLRELYSVPLAGGASTKLNDPLPVGGRVLSVAGDIQITSDSASVVYLAEQITDGLIELFSVPIAGGPVTRLNTDLPANADVNDFLLTPDGTRVIYRAEQEFDNVRELYSVPVTGGVPVKLSPPLPNGGDVLRFKISPTGDRVAFIGDVETNGVTELFSVPVGGGHAIKLNGPLAEDGPSTEGSFQFTPDGRWVVYLAEEDTAEVRELYWVPAAGGTISKVNGPLAEGGDVDSFWMAADSSSVFYTAEEEIPGVFDLWLGRPLVFADGFETGDTSLWSATAP